MTEEIKPTRKYKPLQVYVADHYATKLIAAEEGRDIVDVVADMVAIYKATKRRGGKAAKAGKPLTASEFIAAMPAQ